MYGAHAARLARKDKLDQGEPLTDGAARELYEETGINVDPAHLRLVQTVHHRQDAQVERIGALIDAVRHSHGGRRSACSTA